MDDSRFTLPGELHLTGYDREGEYFYRLNQDLINELRRQRQQQVPRVEQVHSSHVTSVIKRMIDLATKPLPSGIGQFPV